MKTIEQVKPYDILEESVYTEHGHCLVAKGTKLNQRIINRLRQMGYQQLAVRDGRFQDIDIKTQRALKEKTKLRTIQTTKRLMDEYKKYNQVENVREISHLVEDIIDEVLLNDDIGIDITTLQHFDDTTYTHSVSVAVLSLYLAKEMKLNRIQMGEIGLGSILHDIGKLNVPTEILNKPGKLTEQEYNIVKRHPGDGFQQLRDKIDLLSAHIALQHHEKFDGTGYPRKLKGEEIHLYGRLVAVADVYDAITMDRPYRKGMRPNQAIELMMGLSESHFDPTILHKFLSIISPFPNGSIVRLNTGAKAIVVEQNKGFPLRPNILIFEETKKVLREYKAVDLSRELDLTIQDFDEH